MPSPPVVVAVNGSSADLPALAWAADEASSTNRPLLITHGVGHLPAEMTYAERHLARRQRRERGQRVVDRAADWVRVQAPALPLETMVRLLDPAALLPAVSGGAHAVTQTCAAWSCVEGRRPRAPVVVVSAGPADASTIDFAAGYADRRGVGLVVVDGHGPDVARRLLERRAADSLVVLPQPEPHGPSARFSWQVVLEIFARSQSPVALVPEPTGARIS